MSAYGELNLNTDNPEFERIVDGVNRGWLIWTHDGITERIPVDLLGDGSGTVFVERRDAEEAGE